MEGDDPSTRIQVQYIFSFQFTCKVVHLALELGSS